MKHDTFPQSERSMALARLTVLQGELDDLKARLDHRGSAVHASSIAAERASEIVKQRRRRETLFGANLFFDPAWDILLELFVAEATQQRLAVSVLGVAAGIPQTTTVRWISQLEKCGMVLRRPDPLDARRVFVELTSKASSAMQSYFG